MSTFSYFLCDTTENRVREELRDVLVQCGLADVLDDVRDVPEHAVVCQVSSGPNGRSGVLLTPKRGDDLEVPKVVSFQPSMKWIDRGHDCYLCWLPEDPPRPEWLKRRRTFPGYNLQDDCDRVWSVPVIRGPREDDYGSLPRVYAFDADGTPRARLKSEFQDLWAMACRVHDCYVNDLEVDTAWLLQSAVVALAINHRIGFPEVNAFLEMDLPVIDNGFTMRVLHAIIDIHALNEWMAAKKKDSGRSVPDGSSSTPGEPAACQDTAPASVS